MCRKEFPENIHLVFEKSKESKELQKSLEKAYGVNKTSISVVKMRFNDNINRD